MFHESNQLINLIHLTIEFTLSLVCNKMLFVSAADYEFAHKFFQVAKEKFILVEMVLT